jgi:hypothetical protein
MIFLKLLTVCFGLPVLIIVIAIFWLLLGKKIFCFMWLGGC